MKIWIDNSAYGTYHIVCIILCVIAIALATIFLKNIKLEKAVTISFIIGLISESLKVSTYIVANEETMFGYLPKTDLPFQLCSLQILFFIYLKFGKNEKLKRALMCFMIPTCLIGGIAAMLIPTSSSLCMPIISVQYYLYHSCIIWFALYLLISKTIVLTLEDYKTTLAMLFIFAFIAIYLNSWVNDGSNKVNFMYVVKPPASNIPYLTSEYGWGVYFVHYAFLAVFVVTCFYIKPIYKKLAHKE